MMTGDLGEGAAFSQAIYGVDPRGLEQTVFDVDGISGSDQQRLTDQIAERIGDVRVARDLRRDGARGIDRDWAGEDRETAQQFTLCLAQQLIAPIECRAQLFISEHQSGPAENPL